MKKVIVLMAIVAFSALAMAEDAPPAAPAMGGDSAKMAPADTTMKKETKTASKTKHGKHMKKKTETKTETSN
jgi:hypothetical protein